MCTSIIKFFSTKAVQEKIVQGVLSEGQIFIYFYLIMMFDTIQFVLQWLNIAGKQPTIYDLVNIWGVLIINAVGFIIVFFANGGAQGQNLLTKFFAFSFTVGIKYALAFYILELLPIYIPGLASLSYEITVFAVVDILMLFNIAYRIYETR